MSEGDEVGTHLLPRAFFDRCITLSLSLPPSYETLEQIFKYRYPSLDVLLIDKVAKLLDQSWQHPQVETGASINAGLQLLQLLQSQASERDNASSLSFLDIAITSFAKKIELIPTADMNQTEVIQDLVRRVETDRLYPFKERCDAAAKPRCKYCLPTTVEEACEIMHYVPMYFLVKIRQ